MHACVCMRAGRLSWLSLLMHVSVLHLFPPPSLTHKHARARTHARTHLTVHPMPERVGVQPGDGPQVWLNALLKEPRDRRAHAKADPGSDVLADRHAHEGLQELKPAEMGGAHAGHAGLGLPR